MNASTQPNPGSAEITELLRDWSSGDQRALDQVMPLVYERLQEIASGMLTFERPNHTLQPAALVNEAYMRIVQLDRVSWSDRAHFFALAARLMRRILVDHARKVGSKKRGEGERLLPLEAAEDMPGGQPELLALDRVLKDLAKHDPEQAQIVEMRYFGGLSRDEIAEVLGIGSATVTRRWRMARAWLFRELGGPDGKPMPIPSEAQD